MTTVSIDDMRRDLIGCLRRVQAGETLIVTQADEPLAEIKSVPRVRDQNTKQPRPFALSKGKFVVPDDFDDSHDWGT